MKTFGGFLPLEAGEGGHAPHPTAIRMTSGRASLRAILRALNPKRIKVPEYCCAAVFRAVEAEGIPVDRYAIDSQLLPDLAPEAIPGDEAMLVVDYFGLTGARLLPWTRVLADRGIVDATQAFFAGKPTGGWSFNSARKFFGVPDGAYVYPPTGRSLPRPEREAKASAAHLIEPRDTGSGQALALFRTHEDAMLDEALDASRMTQELLARVDAQEVARTRIANFQQLAAALDPGNALRWPLPPGAVPLAYPLLPRPPLDRERLRLEGVFTPCLWEEVADGTDARFGWERTLAKKLIPLPVDQRYSAADMRELLERVERCSR